MRPTDVTRGSSRILKSAPPGFVRRLELLLLLLGALHHRAELEHPERLLAEADARVRKEDRAA